MGYFEFGDDAVHIPPTTNIVLERIPRGGDRESFRLHRRVTYVAHDARTGTTTSYTVPPDETFDTDLASVPQLFTWLVPKSGRHLPAALVHDALVDDPGVDRWVADRMFRDAMGDLGVGLIRRWVMWTAVSLKTIQKRGTTSLRVGSVATLVVIVALGVLATVNLFVDRTLVPWMGSRSVAAELALGLAGAVVVPLVLGVVLWRPIRTAGVIAGVSTAVLLHAMTLVGLVYGFYLLLERLPRRALIAIAAAGVAAAIVGFVWGWLA